MAMIRVKVIEPENQEDLVIKAIEAHCRREYGEETFRELLEVASKAVANNRAKRGLVPFSEKELRVIALGAIARI